MLGERLATIRHSRGLTQDRLAEYVGVDPQTIQRAERGKVSLSLARLNAIAGCLGVGMADLFATGTTPIPDPPWDGGETEVVRAWRKIPEPRRAAAKKILEVLVEG